MTNDIPIEQVLRAILPRPRTAPDDCTCATCREERARDENREAWRASRSAT